MLWELVIVQFEQDPDLNGLITLLDAFAGQPLQKFLLIHLEHGPTVELFRHIASSFPQLQALTLTTYTFNTWSGAVV